MKTYPEFPIEIFYDGACVVCSMEMEHYKRHNQHGKLVFTDISKPDFHADKLEKAYDDFMKEMHVRDANGDYYTGVDAFLAIWSAYPARSIYNLLSKIFSLPGVRSLADLGYALFARYRHLLPKKKVDCDSGTCDLKHRQK
ncbi:MAG: DUF393 domain-containing protein [Desulfuromonas sp.]|nr:MAG: DUF393 domain-containing protein [Desulfuromonas sp.]